MSTYGKRKRPFYYPPERPGLGPRRRFLPPSAGVQVAVVGARYGAQGPRGARFYGRPTAEKKVSDIATATYQVNTTGSFTLLHVPVLGTDYTNRVGRKTMQRSIGIKGRIQTEASNGLPANTSVAAQQARMIIFMDMQPNGAAPAVGDLLNSADPASQLNLNNRDRFRIIRDKMYSFGPYYTVSTATQAQGFVGGNQVATIKLYKKCKIETIFNGTNGGTIADITSGAVYMFWIGSAAAGTNSDCNAVVSTRVRYEDA